MNTPFQFGKMVTGSAFTDRKEYLKLLSENLLGGISTILISPRRLGKSSLVQKCMNKVFSTKDNYRIIMIDLFRLRTEEEFLETYATEAIKCSTSKIEEHLLNVKNFFKTIKPTITFFPGSTGDFSLSFDTTEIKKNRVEILDLPEMIAKKKKIRIIVCIDEFQNMLSYENSFALQKELRSSWQKHSNVTYCLYGSKRHMMSMLFNDSTSPFYRFGAVFFLQRIERKYWIPFIIRAFDKTEKHISADHCEHIVKAMQDHPYYVQQLSHLVWIMTEKDVDSRIISSALDQIVDMNKPFFIKEFESLSGSQVHFLKAVCAGETHLNASDILKKYRLGTSGNVSKNKGVLEKKDIIDIDQTIISFIDPVFEIWFRKYIL
ncbi:MAG: ATP-binding protein [Spirochaetales bacterium]|nr:ATP-binding protein [Spirochaetales bacterium]